MDKNYVRRFWENNSGLENIYWTIDNARDMDSIRCFRHLKDAKDHLENLNGLNGRPTPNIPIAIGTITREQYLKEFAVDGDTNKEQPAGQSTPQELMPAIENPTEPKELEPVKSELDRESGKSSNPVNHGSDTITTKTITQTKTITVITRHEATSSTTVTTTETVTKSPAKTTTVTTIKTVVVKKETKPEKIEPQVVLETTSQNIFPICETPGKRKISIPATSINNRLTSLARPEFESSP